MIFQFIVDPNMEDITPMYWVHSFAKTIFEIGIYAGVFSKALYHYDPLVSTYNTSLFSAGLIVSVIYAIYLLSRPESVRKFIPKHDVAILGLYMVGIGTILGRCGINLFVYAMGYLYGALN